MSVPLLGDRFAPITWGLGLLNVSLDVAARALVAWNREMGRHVDRDDLPVDLAGSLARLEPLVGGARPRQLLISVGNEWTAYFDCLLQGTDAASSIGYLTTRLRCLGLALTCASGGSRNAEIYKPPATGFELFGPAHTDWLNSIRSVSCAFDGTHWVFGSSGTPQAFEDTDAYAAARVRDRFTPEMVRRYARSVAGTDVFDESNYGRAFLVRTDALVGRGAKVMSLRDAQRMFGVAGARDS